MNREELPSGRTGAVLICERPSSLGHSQLRFCDLPWAELCKWFSCFPLRRSVTGVSLSVSSSHPSLWKCCFARKSSLLMLERKLGTFMWLLAGGDGERVLCENSLWSIEFGRDARFQAG